MCAVMALNPTDDHVALDSAVDERLFQAVSGAQTVSSSKYRGLCWDRKHQSWRCRIFYASKQRHIGRFKHALVAARAYDRAAYFLYGEKAILNFSMEEAAADQGDVPLFIRQAKEQAEAAAALAAATEDGSVQLGPGLNLSQTASPAAARNNWQQSNSAGFPGMQANSNQDFSQLPGWRQMLQNLPLQQQQQQQVYVLDQLGNLSCQALPVQQQTQQAQLQQSPSWHSAAASQAAVAAAAAPSAVYTLSEACMPLGNGAAFNPASAGSHGGSSNCSSASQAAVPPGLLPRTVTPGSVAHSDDSMLLSAALSAGVPTGLQQQYGAAQVQYSTAQVSPDERVLLRQTLERQLQKHQQYQIVSASSPQTILQVSSSQGAYVQAPAAGQQVLAQTVYMSQALPAQQQAAMPGVQLLHVPAPPMPLHTQHVIALQQAQQPLMHAQGVQVGAPAGATANGSFYGNGLLLPGQMQHVQQMPGCVHAGGIQELGIVGSQAQQSYLRCNQQQQQSAPVTVGALTNMLNGTLQL